MKKLFYPALFALTLTACTNAKKEEDALQKQVMDVHEKVMADDEKAMIVKMKLDTLIRNADSLKLNKAEATGLSDKLIKADERMSDWMKDFNPDNTGKNHDDIMKYLQKQLEQVKQIDSLLIVATNQSSAYLNKTAK